MSDGMGAGTSTAGIGHRTLAGATRVLFAESLVFPTGIVTIAFLTRQLGAEGYGIYSLAAAVVGWFEWTVAALFARATIKLVGDREDWRPIATRILQLNLAISAIVTAALWVLAPAAAAWLGEPLLARPIRLFALDIPLFTLAYVHRNILTGLGHFGLRAGAVAARWIARLLLIVALVSLGLSTTGAILGSLGASLVEFLIVRRYDRPRLIQRTHAPVRPLYAYALPLFLFAVSARICQQIDLFALKALGSSTVEAGFYAAAQNMSFVPGVVGVAFTPVLLSALARLLREGAVEHARRLGRDSLRLVLLLVPFAAMTAGASEEIAQFVFGGSFRAAAPLLAILIFPSVASVMTAIATTILTAAGKPTWPFALVAPLVPLSIAGHLVAIPRWGALGAAGVTTAAGLLGAAAALAAVYHLWWILPPVSTLVRAAAISFVVYAAALLWPTPSWLLILKLAMLSAVIPSTFWFLREFDGRELKLVRSLLLPPRTARGEGGVPAP
ncbi:flippase [soil metagenome]